MNWPFFQWGDNSWSGTFRAASKLGPVPHTLQILGSEDPATSAYKASEGLKRTSTGGAAHSTVNAPGGCLCLCFVGVLNGWDANLPDGLRPLPIHGPQCSGGQTALPAYRTKDVARGGVSAILLSQC